MSNVFVSIGREANNAVPFKELKMHTAFRNADIHSKRRYVKISEAAAVMIRDHEGVDCLNLTMFGASTSCVPLDTDVVIRIES